MAENIEQWVEDFKKFYFKEIKPIGIGGMSEVSKGHFNPYVYYNEILNDGNDYLGAARMFEKEMTSEQRENVYNDAKEDAIRSKDYKLLGLLERRTVAVKELKLDHERITSRFLNEARTITNPDFNHENIVKGYGLIMPEDGKGMQLLMEYVDAIPIDEIKKYLPIPVNVYVTAKISEALQFCHSKNILHRDVKPLNILVERDKQYSSNSSLSEIEKEYDEIKGLKKIKLTDFGIAKLLGEQSPSQTLAGESFGTPKFYAPECVEHGIKNYNKKSEVFTLCATLYDLLCGIAPIQTVIRSGIEDTAHLMVTLHLTPDFVFPREYNPKVSKLLQNVIMMGLDKDPHKRPTMNGIKFLLEMLIKEKKCVYEEQSLEEKTNIINKQYLELKRNPHPINYWTFSNTLLQIPGKEDQTIDSLTKTIESFNQQTDSKQKRMYVAMCEYLLSVEKRSFNAPKRKIPEQKNNIEQK